jgi:hypothetical protein
VVDLYPFEQTVADGASEADIIEKIDIGGISLIRAAAKNFNDVVIVPSKAEYGVLLDILNKAGEIKVRKTVHLAMAVLMAVCILVFSALNSTSVIDAVYRLASYTYGPILGLFSFGLCCKARVRDKWVPVVAVAAPLLCLLLDLNSVRWFGGYHFSYELLLMNAVFTMLGLCLLIHKKQ